MPSLEFRHRVYLAFQGGGAKGIAHVGALAAVNELPLDIEGVAGTSAGAILAALVAAKYTAQEIFDIGHRTHLLERVAGGAYKRPTELFTAAGWAQIVALTRAGNRLDGLVGWLGKHRPTWQRWSARLIGLATAAGAVWLLPRLTLILLICAAGYLGLRLYRIYRGIAPLTEVWKVIDAALSEKVGRGKTRVTFKDLDDWGGVPLKLVATNLTDQSLELFSVDATPDVAIADAVAASIRLPFIFKPWTVDIRRMHSSDTQNHAFLDGGLMSNLPVWSFDEERSLDPDAVTIAFGLQAIGSKAKGSKHWLIAAIDAVVAGPRQIHLRGIDRLVHIPLDCKLDMLDFDASFDEFKSEVERAKEKTSLTLDRELTEIPELVRRALEAMRRSVWTDLRQMHTPALPEAEGWPRIALAVQRPDDRLSMMVAYGFVRMGGIAKRARLA